MIDNNNTLTSTNPRSACRSPRACAPVAATNAKDVNLSSRNFMTFTSVDDGSFYVDSFYVDFALCCVNNLC